MTLDRRRRRRSNVIKATWNQRVALVSTRLDLTSVGKASDLKHIFNWSMQIYYIIERVNYSLITWWLMNGIVSEILLMGVTPEINTNRYPLFSCLYFWHWLLNSSCGTFQHCTWQGCLYTSETFNVDLCLIKDVLYIEYPWSDRPA